MKTHGREEHDSGRAAAYVVLNRKRLALCCVLIACCVVAETLLRWQSGHVLSYLLIPCSALVSLALLPLMPESGAWLAVTLYCVGLVSPFPMSYSYSLAMVLAVAIIWRDGRAMAALAAVLGVSALLIDQKVLFGLGPSDSVVVSFAYCMFAVVIGVVSRWQADRARQAEQKRRQTERDAIARALHDRISNDLAYAIMRVDRDIERSEMAHDDSIPHASDTGRESCRAGMSGPSARGHRTDAAASEERYAPMDPNELRDLRRIIETALADTHQVIDALDRAAEIPATAATVGRSGMPVSMHHAVDRGVPARAVVMPRPDATGTIIDRIDSQEERLRALGFDGQTTVPDAFPQLSASRAELLTGLLGEIYANIAKHGDPAHGYVVSIAADGDDIVVTAVDTPLPNHGTGSDDSGLGLGTGLDRYRNMGVDICVNGDSTNQWSMTARFPVKA
ncbi:hypothetical protein [Bifidobacterium miconisargentati]|uniref:hypothetical protein n=1 Tax=Bifidobacterium miconisargentati TaxID=2834437 RepID=UPI001F222EBF|nr:hypothetical protein [Bifidobacterium miconisargentati]